MERDSNSSFRGKIIILLTWAILIIVCCELNLRKKTDGQISHLPPLQALCWDGKRLVLSDRLQQDSSCSMEGDIPAEYTPLFFKKIPGNSADRRLLESVPGVGVKTASKIIALRKAKGGRLVDEDLLHIKGIGKKKLENIKKYITFQ